jgi:CheY-like chemotaxis protein
MAAPVKTQIVPIHAVPTQDLENSPKSPLILIVDDEQLIVDTLVAILRRAGYRTLGAYGGKSGLQLAVNFQPDLLITDIFMPDLDGATLALQVAEILPACRILLISGHAAMQPPSSSQKSAAEFRLLSKPVHPSALLKEIEETLLPFQFETAGSQDTGGHGENFA